MELLKKEKINTIHTARTIMFSEVEKVMDFSVNDDSFTESFKSNVFGKKSSDGQKQTAAFLKRLYGFDLTDPQFTAFKYFWKNSDTLDKPLIAFIYAINHDDLLAQSIEVLYDTKIGDKASIEKFEDIIEKYHPNKYTNNTRKSLAQNIASAWKHAGFIVGKVRNIRSQPEINYKVACFAFFIAYLKGDRGEIIWSNIGVKALCLSESKLRQLAVDSSKHDLMQYQYAGSVTAISFNHLINKIGINAN